jgi:flagellar assembly protein FliH
MILLSDIIKAEYVIYDNPVQSNNDPRKSVEQEAEILCSFREDLYEIYDQRETILKEAEEEALRIISSAKKDAENEIDLCKKTGYEAGYNDGMEIGKSQGYKDGYEAGKTEITEALQEQNQSALNEIAQMLEKIEAEKEAVISQYEKDLTRLAIDIAEKIIRHKIHSEDSSVAAIIESAIKDYRNVEWVKIYISDKDDAIAIRADKKLINELNKISDDVKIDVSEELKEGSVIVETPDGIVDAGIDTQLKNLKEMVLSKNAV